MGLNLKEKPDFAGWATVYNVKCGDGRTLKPGAFKGVNGTKVPIVYNHDHQNMDAVLGHAYLEERDKGIYAYGYLNDSENGQIAKECVKHGDVYSLSIYANKLKEQAGNVYHGIIREVSLVLASANPKSYIDTVLVHSDVDSDEWEAEMYFNEPIETDVEIAHSDVDTEKKEEPEETGELEHSDDKPKEENKMADQNQAGGGEEKTIGEVFEAMTEEQKNVVYAIVGKAVEDALAEAGNGGNEDMKHNAFENEFEDNGIKVLSHSEIADMFKDAKTTGSLRQAVLQHTDDYGIENIDYMFPEAKLNSGDPQFIKREDDWVSRVMSGVSKNPFSRIKSLFADITEDEARAKGYIKGHYKKEEVFTLLRRTTEPTTVYKKQKIDRQDVIDITDFDVVALIKKEMRMMYDEECARAILVGDGRPTSSEDHIDETHIRPIWKDEDLFAVKVDVAVAAGATEATKAKTFINTCIKSRKKYKGSGNPTLFTTEDLVTECLLLEDGFQHKLYKNEQELATALRVKDIVTVPVMEGLSREDGKGNTKNLMGIIVNLVDYKVGTDKGGELTMFDDFDIDFNQMKYLMEGRFSGALVKPFSALVLEESVSVTLTVTPTDPSTTRYGKEVDDLQSNIEINEGSRQIVGTLRYVTGYTGYSGDPAEQSGNYLALDFAATPAESVIQVEVIGGNSEGNPVTVDDGYVVFRIRDRKQKIKVTSTNGDNVIERTYGLGSLKLKTE